MSKHHIQVRWKLIWVVVAAFAVPIMFGALKGLVDFLYWQPPPLLTKATAGGGQWGACPSMGSARFALPEAISPELDRRLAQQFPPGSSEIALVQELQKQPFKMRGACNGDTAIRFAEFKERDLRAAVYWRVDAANTIVWTKGFVFIISS